MFPIVQLGSGQTAHSCEGEKIILPEESISNSLGLVVGLKIDLRLFTRGGRPLGISPIKLEF